MAENGTSNLKRRVISFDEFIETTKSGEPLRFDSDEILKETDLRELFKEQEKEYDDARLVDKIKFLHGEIKSKEGQIKELERTRDESLDVLRGFVGEKLADRIRDLPDSLKKLVGYVKTMSDSYKSLKSHLKASEEHEKARLQVAQDAVNGFFLSFGHIADPAEEKEAYRLLGQPVERMLSSDGAERLSGPDETMKVTINDSQLADAVLAKVAKNYDRLFSSASSNAAVLKSSIEVLRQELEKRGLGSNEIDALLKKAETTALNKPMELRRQIDETVDKMSKEEIAIKFNQLKQELAQTVKDKAAIEEQKKALESRRSDVYAVIKELNEIDIILEKSDLYTCNPMSGLGLSSSKIIESIPFELSKRRTALADIVAESIKLQKLVDEKEKLIAENSKMISAQKDELQKRKVLFVPDPVLRSIFSRFVLAYEVNKNYADANNLPHEALPSFTVNSEEGVSVLLDNYLSVLTKMRDSVLVDIVADENNLWKKYDKIKPDGDLKKKKDVQLLRKYVASLISAEAGRVARNIQSVKGMIESINIPLEKLLEKTDCESLDAACLSSYIVPMYERIAEIDAVPEKQAKLASKYGFSSYAELKSRIYSELSFDDARKLASRVGKSVRTKKEAAVFQRKVSSEVSSLEKADSAREMIVKDFIVPGLSYERIKSWCAEVYNRLPEISNGSAEKKLLAKMVKGKRAFASSFDYLRRFVNDPAFAKIDADLAYLAPVKKFLGNFSSGIELNDILCGEIKQVEAYKSARQSFK